MKGIILAGGSGTRLYPVTTVASKQLQPIYDKPMIYYPVSTLMLAGIREILLISTPQDIPKFEALLGDGSAWGLSISYKIQPKPEGIAQAFLLGESFIDNSPVTLILGDNLFYGKMGLDKIVRDFSGGARVFGYPVSDPERYGVVEFDADGKVLSIEEKPAVPKSHYAVPGLYIYDNKVVEMTKAMKPSARGELEITDLNLTYWQRDELTVTTLGRGIAWLDTGTPESLLEASMFIHAIESRQGLKISCPEEIAFRCGYLSGKEFATMVETLPRSSYREYLERIVDEETV
ncbi:MAG: glucose-1-phosphate thymidylyltransferase RfbA [Lentisphaeria bacterium]|nr:glucose-1-phosphate thymidylyltransferase RfbA [Lentisphaeria bacterium]